MKIEMTPEQMQMVQTFMELLAAHNARQAAEARAQEAIASELAGKLAAGSADLDEPEVRLLLTFVQGIDVLRGVNPAMFTEDTAARLRELQPKIVAAKTKLDN